MRSRLRSLDHHAGKVAARRAREHRIGHQPGRRLDVGRIDSRRLDLDQHLIGAARQRMALDHRRNRGSVLRLRMQPHAAGFDRDRFGGSRHFLGILVCLLRKGQELPFRPLVVNTLGLAKRAFQCVRSDNPHSG